ncbi:hypothetical protein BD311DRAFT_204228, partial [Dichomitus squalens]
IFHLQAHHTQDEGTLEQVWLASGAIRHHLGRIIRSFPSGEVEQSEVRDMLCLLLNHSTLALLFDYRSVIHSIVARNAAGQAMSTVVCWADLILSQLGQAVLAASTGLCSIVPSDHNQPPAILVHREDDMLRAAVQLPERWCDVAGMLNSEHNSPAAIRLASSLLFGVHVMAPQLAGDVESPDCEIGYTIVQALDARIRRVVAYDTKRTPIVIQDSVEQERITYAMFVTLYAAAASSDPMTLDLSCRPQSTTVLLEMIETILQLDPSHSAISIISSPAVIDIAKVILTRWGMTVPWTWSTWTDGRLHNAEVLEHLTATWLQHVHWVPDWPLDQVTETTMFCQCDLVNVLARHPMPALSMIARLLLCTLRAMKSDSGSTSLSISALKFIARLCWSLKYLLRVVEVDRPSTVVIYSMMCTLFAILPDGELELSAKDALLEALSYSPDALKVAANVFLDQKAECVRRLDERLLSLSSDMTHASPRNYLGLRITRQTVQFLTLIWIAGAPMYFHVDSVHRFVSALLRKLNSGSSTRCMLFDATLCLLTVFKKRRDEITFQTMGRCCEDESVWALTISAEPTDILVVSSLAAYVSATAQIRSCNQLLWAEAWSYFRDALLLTSISHIAVAGSEELLGLFVAPAICRALLSLMEHATDDTRQFYFSSPWSTSLKTHLNKLSRLADCSEGDVFVTTLRQRITLVAEDLCRYLQDGSGFSKTAPSPDIEPVYCSIRTMPCLLLSVT